MVIPARGVEFTHILPFFFVFFCFALHRVYRLVTHSSVKVNGQPLFLPLRVITPVSSYCFLGDLEFNGMYVAYPWHVCGISMTCMWHVHGM